jgi:hypothetical protein
MRVVRERSQSKAQEDQGEEGRRETEGRMMRAPIRVKQGRSAAVVVLTVVVVLLVGGWSAAYGAPIKESVASHFGAEVDASSGGSVCTVASKDACQEGLESSLAGGFSHPYGVAVAPDGNVYVTDGGNSRVQELTASGEFVLTFGWEVNETKDGDPTATAAERNVCTAASHDVCKAGVEGALAGQMAAGAYSIAIDHATGNVYVQDQQNWRVDEYTPAGAFVLTIGAEVNRTKDEADAPAAERDVCAAKSGDVCKAGVENAPQSTAHGAFNFAQGSGDLLAVGGPEDLLYVGDEHRVQELDPLSGAWKGEISLASLSSEPHADVVALALDDSCALHEPALSESTTPRCAEFDPEDGDLYLAYKAGSESTADAVRKFTEGGVEVKNGRFPLTLGAREAGSKAFEVQYFTIDALAVDAANRLAVGEQEILEEASPPRAIQFRAFGSLLDGGTGRLLTEFAVPGEKAAGLGFSVDDRLYGAVSRRNEVVAYSPLPVAELVAGGAACAAGPERETDATYDCTLNGEANPEGVAATEAWFQWGRTPVLGSETPRQAIATSGALEPVLPAPAIEGLRPNATYYDRLAADDENVQPPETALASETASFGTPYASPRIVGEAAASFVKSSSAVMTGELNPENARTEYFFEYAPEGQPGVEPLAACPGVRKASCPGVAATPALESSTYGAVETVREATGLIPGARYRYRLVAESENSLKTEKAARTSGEGTFTTAPSPTVTALTGAASAIAATSANVAGSVNPDGQTATYAFELGVYAGAATRYGVVFSGSAGAGTLPIAESLALTGLQPGTTYAYRIKIESGYGRATGATATFTTTGLPSVLTAPIPLAQLAIPAISFPAPAIAPTTKTAAKPTSKKRVSKKHKTKKKGSRRRSSPRRSRKANHSKKG